MLRTDGQHICECKTQTGRREELMQRREREEDGGSKEKTSRSFMPCTLARISTQPTLSQFQSLKIRRLANLRRILMLQNFERVGRVAACSYSNTCGQYYCLWETRSRRRIKQCRRTYVKAVLYLQWQYKKSRPDFYLSYSVVSYFVFKRLGTKEVEKEEKAV